MFSFISCPIFTKQFLKHNKTNKHMKQAHKQTMYQEILKHGENLNRIFNTGIDPVNLCKKLRSLEIKASKLALDYCNGENGVNSDNWEVLTSPILAQVRKLLYPNGMTGDAKKDWCIFINGDCRGYALKIRSEYIKDNNITLYTDWGGYGILAPDFTP